MSELLQSVLQAHGDIDHWNKFTTVGQVMNGTIGYRPSGRSSAILAFQITRQKLNQYEIHD
jgi:hypothetical protein